jgi:hypothetical protein
VDPVGHLWLCGTDVTNNSKVLTLTQTLNLSVFSSCRIKVIESYRNYNF